MRNQIVGKFGEELACNFLIKRGYLIKGVNVRVGSKELDIIAEKDKELIFVEVKTRTSSEFGEADEAVGTAKLKYLKSAIDLYLGDLKAKFNDVRLDLIAVDIYKSKKTAKIKHYKNIF